MMLCAEEGNAIVDALETTYRVLFNICTSFCSLYLSKILTTNNSGLLSWKQMKWEMAWRLSSASTRRVQGWKAHILAFLHSKCLHRLINISSFRWKMRVDCWIVLKNTWVHTVHSNCILKYLQERRRKKRNLLLLSRNLSKWVAKNVTTIRSRWTVSARGENLNFFSLLLVTLNINSAHSTDEISRAIRVLVGQRNKWNGEQAKRWKGRFE